MFTREDLLAMKYKELVVLAKQYGVYKPRCKKVFLFDKLSSLLNNELVMDLQNSTEENFEEATSIQEMPSVRIAPLRRETFGIEPCDLGINLPPSRRETFDIDIEENITSKERGKISICRQNTFSLEIPRKNLCPEKISRTPVLRQNTFSIDKPSQNHKLEEMPGIICQELKCTPTIKPYIVKETCPSSVGFNSPITNKNAVLPSIVGPVLSIGQRLENQRSAKSERRPSSRGSKQKKDLSINMVTVTPVRVHKTSLKGGRIEKKITPSKLPNFKAIHMREFSKMESIVEHTQRKAERIKSLLTPVKFNLQFPTTNIKGASLAMSHIPVNKFDLKSKVDETKSLTPSKPTAKTPNRGKHSIKSSIQKITLGLRKSDKSDVSKVKERLKFIDSPMTKVRRKSGNRVDDINKKMVANPKKRVENVKEIITTKMHPFSVERNRAKGRDFLQCVRMNRRFQLQMEVMRKAKV